MKLWLSILILVLIAGCSTEIKTFSVSDPDKIGVKSDNIKGTIFKSSYPASKLDIRPEDSLKRFTPSQEDIQLSETLIKSQIAALNKNHINQFGQKEFIERNLNKYFRQYIGFINEKGDSVIHVNFYWNSYTLSDKISGENDSRLNYNSDYSTMYDGGSHFWNLNVNLTTKALYNLSVNGVG
jgi:hypothetical protein